MAADQSPESSGTASSQQPYLGTRPGGRSARVRASVIAAAAAEVAEHGYDGFSIPRVAQRAGVAVTTVHRRWAGKPGLLSDVFSELTQTMVPDPAAATLEADLRQLAVAVADMLRQPATIRLLRSAFALPDAELDEVRRRFWASRFAVAQTIIDRAIARGDVAPGTDGWSIVEPVHAPIWMRMLITGLPVDEAFIDDVVSQAVARSRRPTA